MLNFIGLRTLSWGTQTADYVEIDRFSQILTLKVLFLESINSIKQIFIIPMLSIIVNSRALLY